MKVYYFINNLSESDYRFFIEKVAQIRIAEDVDQIIDECVHKIWDGDKNQWKTQRAAFVEAMIFVQKYLQDNLGGVGDIVWVHKMNFLIHNENVYVFSENRWNIIDSQTWFVTCRDSWNHPFFYNLLLNWHKHIRLYRPNHSMEWWHRDKLYFISQLWKDRNKYVWDIVIPLVMDSSHHAIKSLFLFVKATLKSKIVMKKNFWVQWQNVKAIDLSSNVEYLDEALIRNFFWWPIYNYASPYFISYYDIETEFRIYYIHEDNKTHIYSIKNRVNEFRNDGSVFEKPDFTYSSINTKWLYCHIQDLKNSHSDIEVEALNIIPKLWLQTGVLELCRCKDGKIRFIEVNALWWTLMFPWEDEKQMQQFYLDLWDSGFKNNLTN